MHRLMLLSLLAGTAPLAAQQVAPPSGWQGPDIVTSATGEALVTWNAPDAIGKVVEVYASQYSDRVAVAYTMRRLGKEAYMFVYNGEKHGLRQRENQKHWTVHMAEYFDYFFKDAPKPDWMEHGVPYLEKGKRDVSVFYKKSTDRD